MNPSRVVAVVTGTRAEFGLLSPVMRAIGKHENLRLKTIVSGMHLVKETWKDVTAAGFEITARVKMQERGKHGRTADVDALGKGISHFGKAFAHIRPDVVLVLGDRIEAFAAATAASIGGIRVAHIHGGDRAEGVADEAMRHAITKLAHLHFPATAQSKRRIIRMGEDKKNVVNVGSPAADGLELVQPATRAFDLLIMQHPIGDAPAAEEQHMRQTLAAATDYSCIALVPNSDPGCRGIHDALRKARIDVIEHVPRPRFLSLVKKARAIVGNSSAGLIEAAVLKVPCVNIGPRQAGREKPANVIDCGYGEKEVKAALRKALKMDLARMRHPYGPGNTGDRIAAVLSVFYDEDVPVKKRNAY